MEVLLFTCLVMAFGGFGIMAIRAKRHESYKKHMPELTSRYAVQCVTDIWNVELRLSPSKLPPVICLVTDEVFVVFNLKTKQEDVYSLKQFLWGTFYHKSPLDEKKGLVFHFQQNQQLKTIHLWMHKRTHEKLLDCFQRVTHTMIPRAGFPMDNHRDVMVVEQDIHGVWQLGNVCKLITTPEHFIELTGGDDTIARMFPLRDINKVEVIQPYDDEINGTLPKGFNGIVRLRMTGETICYATKKYIRYGLDVSGFLQVPYENIERKDKLK